MREPINKFYISFIVSITIIGISNKTARFSETTPLSERRTVWKCALLFPGFEIQYVQVVN